MVRENTEISLIDAYGQAPQEGLYSYGDFVFNTVSISYENNGWYLRDGEDKQRLNSGFFITCKPIDKKKAKHLAQIFEKRAAFIQSELELLAQSQKPKKKRKWRGVFDSRYSSGPGDNIFVFG